jgi:hypothetical protein
MALSKPHRKRLTSIVDIISARQNFVLGGGDDPPTLSVFDSPLIVHNKYDGTQDPQQRIFSDTAALIEASYSLPCRGFDEMNVAPGGAVQWHREQKHVIRNFE